VFFKIRVDCRKDGNLYQLDSSLCCVVSHTTNYGLEALISLLWYKYRTQSNGWQISRNSMYEILQTYNTMWAKMKELKRGEDHITSKELVDDMMKNDMSITDEKVFREILEVHDKFMQAKLKYLDLWNNGYLYGFLSNKTMTTLLPSAGRFLLRFSKSRPEDIAVSCMTQQRIMDETIIANQDIITHTIDNIILAIPLYKELVTPFSVGPIAKTIAFKWVPPSSDKYNSLLRLIKRSTGELDLPQWPEQTWDTVNYPTPGVTPSTTDEIFHEDPASHMYGQGEMETLSPQTGNRVQLNSSFPGSKNNNTPAANPPVSVVNNTNTSNPPPMASPSADNVQAQEYLDTLSPPNQVIAWMQSLNLSEDYTNLIIDNAVDGFVLSTMETKEDWHELGITKFGDVRKLLYAVKVQLKK